MTVNRALLYYDKCEHKPFSLSKQLQDLSVRPNVPIRDNQSRLSTWTLSGVREEQGCSNDYVHTDGTIGSSSTFDGLGTPGTWNYSINTSRNLLLSVLLYLLWILLHWIDSEWVCPYTIRYRGLRREMTPSSPRGHPLAWVLSSTFSPVAAISPVSGECRRKRQDLPTITWQPRSLYTSARTSDGKAATVPRTVFTYNWRVFLKGASVTLHWCHSDI